jgi:subtilase family serine protease
MPTHLFRPARPLALLFLLVPLVLAGCRLGPSTSVVTVKTPTPVPTSSAPFNTGSFTPEQMRAAYGLTSLYQRGVTGKGQTVVVIDSFGSPTMQQDLDVFSQHFGLPNVTVQVFAPLGTKAFDPADSEMQGWAGETELDVEMIHALAPDASIVLLTSPVDETEGVQGLPEFRQLEQYAVDHKLGNVVSMSWSASEASLNDTAGKQEVQLWTDFFQKATTQQGMSFFAASGDNGATDYVTISPQRKLSPTPTVGFPADNPWVTGVGGTRLLYNGTSFEEEGWDGSGGGFSQFFATPGFQQALPSSVQTQLNQRRGVPDIAASADPSSGLLIYAQGHWGVIGGTSAATPAWAAIGAIANQVAGHPLGFLNPALYKVEAANGQDFRDVTVGDNSFHGGGVDVQGYPAVTGWDPITGLGTPNSEKLLPDLVAAAA